MRFEESQVPEMIGPLLVKEAVSDIPLFGHQKANVDAIVNTTLLVQPVEYHITQDEEAGPMPLPDSFNDSLSTADKLRALRSFSKETLKAGKPAAQTGNERSSLEEMTLEMDELSTDRTGPPSNRRLHEQLLSLGQQTRGFDKKAQVFLDHLPLIRANEKYLFDFAANRDIVSDDPWLRDLWDWIAGK